MILFHQFYDPGRLKRIAMMDQNLIFLTAFLKFSPDPIRNPVPLPFCGINDKDKVLAAGITGIYVTDPKRGMNVLPQTFHLGILLSRQKASPLPVHYTDQNNACFLPASDNPPFQKTIDSLKCFIILTIRSRLPNLFDQVFSNPSGILSIVILPSALRSSCIRLSSPQLFVRPFQQALAGISRLPENRYRSHG